MIPPVAHLIWLGRRLPWICGLSVQSALVRGGFERVVLHHEPGLDLGEWAPRFAAAPAFEARVLDPERLLGAPGVAEHGLREVYRELSAPAARANVLRAALLAAEGGVYLDMDTVTVGSLTPLRESAGFFCGEEPLAFPADARRRPLRMLRGVALHGLRAVCANAADGPAWFRRIEPLFARAANNAVIGTRPGHPLLVRLLRGMAELPREQRTVRFALGTHLLQRTLAGPREADVVVHPPEVFYPLGPEISRQWFRLRPHADPSAFLAPSTRVVHWYASVRVQAVTDGMTADTVRRRAGDVPFCALVRDLVPDG